MLVKTKMLGLMLATAMVSTSPILVWADTGVDGTKPSHQSDDWHHGQNDQLAKVLNLNVDQVKQLKDSREKQMQAMKTVVEQIKANRDAFDAEILKAAPDMSKLNDIQTQLKTIQSQMIDNHLNSILEIKKILTPEQFAGYVALEKSKKMMHHGREHKHWGDKDHGGRDSGSQE